MSNEPFELPPEEEEIGLEALLAQVRQDLARPAPAKAGDDAPERTDLLVPNLHLGGAWMAVAALGASAADNPEPDEWTLAPTRGGLAPPPEPPLETSAAPHPNETHSPLSDTPATIAPSPRSAVTVDAPTPVGALPLGLSRPSPPPIGFEHSGGAATPAPPRAPVAEQSPTPATPFSAAPTDLRFDGPPIAESATGGTVIGRLIGVDSDEALALRFSIVDATGAPFDHPLFVLDGDLVRLKPGAQLDFETAPLHTLLIAVTDSGGPTAIREIQVTVSDVNEAPTGVFAQAPLRVGESVRDGGDTTTTFDPGGQIVGRLTAPDPDAGDSISYTIIGGRNDLFYVDGDLVRVRPSVMLDADTAPLHELVIQATDAHGETAIGVLSVDVTNVIGLYQGADVAEMVRGSSEEDVIATAGGDDVVRGSAGADDMDGGAGRDTLDYSQSGAAVRVDLLAGQGIGGDAEGDTIRNFEDVLGSAYDDQLAGDSADNSFSGQAGDDLIDGRQGTDMAHFSGDWHDYDIARSIGADGRAILTVHDRTPGRDGTDTLIDVEFLNFNGHVISAAEAPHQAPSDLKLSNASVSEIAANGTVVGAALVTDANGAHDSFTFTLLDDAEGRFVIDPSTGVVTVADGLRLDAEQAASHTIRVQVRDSHGFTYFEDLTIAVTNRTPEIITGDARDNRFVSDSGNDTLRGGAGNDTLEAGGGNDILDGGDGDDRLFGGAGDDTLIYIGGADVLDGGTGIDTLDLSGAASGVSRLDFEESALELQDGSSASLQGIERVIGTRFDDVIGDDDGLGVARFLDGGDGDDTLTGDDQDDTLLGGDGDDTLRGAVGDDILSGGAGTDTAIYSGAWADYAISYDAATQTYTIADRRPGSPDGTDTVSGLELFQFADRTIGVTELLNVAPSDILVSGPLAVQEDVASGGTIGAPYAAGAAQPIVATLTGQDINGDTLTYTLVGGATDRFEIVNGNQIRVRAGATFDYETTASYTVTIEGRDAGGLSVTKTITIQVTDFEGVFAGTPGFDTATGTSEEDLLTGGAGMDTLSGGDGNDTIRGGADNDILRGDAGDDVFLVGPGDGFDQVDGGAGQDVIRATANNTVIGLTGNSPWANATTGVETIESGGFANITIALADWQRVDFTNVTLTGIQQINGAGFNETITGSAGDDRIAGGAGDDTLSGGDGNDTFLFGPADAGFDRIDGGAGADRILATGDNTVIGLHSGSPWTSGVTNVELIDGGGFANVVLRTGDWGRIDLTGTTVTGIARIEGAAWGETLIASAGDDTLRGFAGDDTLDGGAGIDTAIYSGAWADYTITYNATTQTYTIADRRPGSPDGTDTVTRVERFQFADRTITVTTPDDLLNNAPTDIAWSANNLLTNGTFASGVGGWAPNENAFFEIQTVGSAGHTATTQADGATYLELDGFSDVVESVSQTIRTIAGESYTLTFQHQARNGFSAVGSNVIEVVWNGTVIGTVSTDQLTWQNAQFNVTGTGGLDVLTFRETTASNDGGGSFLDNVQLIGSYPSVQENAAAGTVITTLSVLDADAGDTVTYALSGAGAANFAIVNGQIVVATGAALDFETQNLYQLTLTATDASGATRVETIPIAVRNTSGILQGSLAGTATSSIGADTLTGTAEDDVINGYAGNDKLSGGAGNDTLLGGVGDDRLNGGAGSDTLVGGAGADILDASGNLLVNGSFEDSVYTGGVGQAPVGWTMGGRANGGLHSDAGRASEGTMGPQYYALGGWSGASGGTLSQTVATVVGETYTLTFDIRATSFVGATGGQLVAEALSGATVIGTLTATDAADGVFSSFTLTFTATSTATTIRFTDTSVISGGQDLDVDLDNVRLTASTGAAELLVGGDGADLLYGGGGADVLIGESNLLRNGSFATETTQQWGMTGGQLDHWTVTSGDVDAEPNVGPAGAVAIDLSGWQAGSIAQTFDTVAGQSYTVTFLQATNGATGSSAVRVTAAGVQQDFAHTNEAGTNWSTVNTQFVERSFTFTATGSTTTLSFQSLTPGNGGTLLSAVSVAPTAEGGADVLQAGAGADWLMGQAGNDTLRGDAGRDLLQGGDGNDTLNGGAGNDALFGGAGDDTAVFSGNWQDYTITRIASGFQIADTRPGAPDGVDTVSAVERVSFANGTYRLLLGTTGNDDPLTATNERTLIVGLDGADRLVGGAGNDALSGGAGGDTLTGGQGADVIDGGAGTDTAIYSGARADYAITYNAATQTYTIADNRTGAPDGTDAVTGVERFQFADLTITVTTPDDLLNAAPTGLDVVFANSPFNYVVNGSFEAWNGGIADNGWWQAASHVLGWTREAGAQYELLRNHATNSDGVYGLDMEASPGNLTIAQTITGLRAGEVYSLTFTASNRTGTASTAQLEVYWGGQLIGTITPPTNATIEDYQFDIQAGAGDGLNVLRFREVGAGSDGMGTTLDAVSITAAVPELSITENDAMGTPVGEVQASDPDGDALTYALLDNAGGRFTINAQTGEIFVGATPIDYEAATSHTLSIQVRDPDGFTATRTVIARVNNESGQIVGSSAAETLTGTAEEDRIIAFSGNDTINAGAGNDWIEAGDGDDTLIGGAGADTLMGGAGADILYANDAVQTTAWLAAPGAAGTGVSFANPSFSTISFDNSQQFTTVIFDAAQADSYQVVRVTAFLRGAPVAVFTGDIYGENASLQVDLGDGNSFDELRIEQGNQDPWTGAYTFGPLDPNTFTVIAVHLGGETLAVGDVLSGGDGNDRLYGGGGGDALNGGAGDDTLVGNVGADAFDGGAGFDTVDYAEAPLGVTLMLATPDADGLGWYRTTPPQGAYGGDAAGDTFANIEAINTTAFDDIVYGGATGLTVRLGDGDDVFDTRNDQTAADTVYGGAGLDYIFGGGGNDVLEGGDGDDLLKGESGDDTLRGDAGTDYLMGGDGQDKLYGGTGFDRLEGGAGNDALFGEADADYLNGDHGDDTLHGGAGDDVIYGGAGNDILVGGAGSDTLQGGGGADTFVWARGDGADWIHGDTNWWSSGGSWIDEIYLDTSAGALTYGADWTLTLTSGSFTVDSANNRLILSQDADGVITVSATGETITFQDIDQIRWGP